MSLIATNVRVRLGRKQILDGVDFAAEGGQVTAIVGPNGSGKTTLLKALTGEEGNGAGITLNGRAVDTLKAWQVAAMRAVMPQASSLAFPFTAIEVVRLGLQAGVHAADRTLPRRALDRVGLGSKAEQHYQQMSGGEQARVHLARALCQVWEPTAHGQPSWLFLDEPVSALDIGHQLQVMEITRQFAQAGGGVVAVMHDLNLTALYADRVVLMRDGCILASGPVETVMTSENLSAAYGCALRVNHAPTTGHTFLLPHAAGAHAA
ncbi:iron complex transport system ATP-binding protein [Ketogulonicigenium robustum]|uniref:Iron complex transport system ATP-binding protein n=1 Tax=Ketogulonicigenium robustum TaxID=92947 RepID=A0A1W6P0F6_9RHOB|nr:heme ABC transporter ATP-binding protein [Ketogulonicigenium robustum]ARO14988.1 iron complex transport system ATP-binding protein [Ketogulonicigenium robustum]